MHVNIVKTNLDDDSCVRIVVIEAFWKNLNLKYVMTPHEKRSVPVLELS